MKAIGIMLCAALPCLSFAQKSAEDGFDRYRSIVERMPFGRPPPNFDPSNPAAAALSRGGGAGGKTPEEAQEEQERRKKLEQMAKTVRVSIMNVTPGGYVVVGFTDDGAKPAANYLLREGESRGGWTLKDADPVEKIATLEKDGVELRMLVGGGLAADETDGAEAGDASGRALRSAEAPAGDAVASARTLPAADSASAAPSAVAESPLARLRARRKARVAEEEARRRAAEAAEAARAEEEAHRKAEEEARRKAEEEARRLREEEAAEERKRIQDELQKIREEREAERRREAEAAAQGEKSGEAAE